MTYDDFWSAILESSIEDPTPDDGQGWKDLVDAFWNEFSAQGDFSEEAMCAFVESKE